ncbi:MAG: VCBS repeat-containing protein [Kofleriaceae bacterium]|nr:VCBS repeat-containing protein [Kofleriaceae bacterium]
MSFRKILLSCTSLGLIASCDPRVFDDLSDSAWVHSAGKPSSTEFAGFSAGLIGGSDGSGNLHYFVAAEKPALLLVTYTKSGSRSSQEVLLEGRDQLPVPTIMASDPSAFAATSGNVAVAVIANGTPALAMFRAENKEASSDFLLAGSTAATGIAFGVTDISAETDLLAAGGQDLNLVSDYKNKSGGAAESCSLGGATGGLILADLDVSAGAEYVVGVAGTVVVGQASSIATGSGCALLGAPIMAPGGEASFGRTLTSGDFDGNGETDLVIAAPDENAVYVYMNWTVAVPTMGVKIANPAGSKAFGANVAVGDFNDDGQDELVISDHARDAGGATGAGTVFIYGADNSGQFAAPIELYDASPEGDQAFGKSLTVAKAFGGVSLVVGAKNEVFTYFRTPVSGDGDSRE